MLTTTNTADLVAAAAAPHTELVRVATGSRLDAPTPCRDWDLRALLGHLRYWTPVLAAVGRREALPATVEGEIDLVTGDWPAALDAARADLVAVWSEPATWDGTVRMGGPDPLPAPMIGGMVLGELVLHGWDLGATLGLRTDWPAEVLVATLDAVVGMAVQGREMGIFGPAVAVPPDAPTLDRVVALSGRDPGWSQ